MEQQSYFSNKSLAQIFPYREEGGGTFDLFKESNQIIKDWK